MAGAASELLRRLRAAQPCPAGVPFLITRSVDRPLPLATHAVAQRDTRATAMPTEQEMEALESIPSDLERELGRINEMLLERMPAFFQALDAADVPWTPGRSVRLHRQ